MSENSEKSQTDLSAERAEKLKAYKKKYREEHKESITKYRIMYEKAHADEIREYQRKHFIKKKINELVRLLDDFDLVKEHYETEFQKAKSTYDIAIDFINSLQEKQTVI